MEEGPKLSENFPVFLHELDRLFRPISLGVSAHVDGFFHYNHTSGGFLVGFLSLGSLFDRVSEVIGNTALLLRAMSWEVFSLHSVFVVP